MNGSNLGRMKSYLIMHYVFESIEFLNRDTFEEVRRINEPRVDLPDDEEEEDHEKVERSLQFDFYINSTPIPWITSLLQPSRMRCII